MNKIGVYITLILLYLGLSTALMSKRDFIEYVKSKEAYASVFAEEDATLIIILDNYFTAGFLIKTYYHRYKIIYPYKVPRYITVRVSPQLYKEHLDNLGMSVFRISEVIESASTLALPPGSMFIGDFAYGNWVYLDSGRKVWQFKKIYQSMASHFKWVDFYADTEFYESLNRHIETSTAFYGLNSEFGTKGSVTRNAYPDFYSNIEKAQLKFLDHIKNYFSIKKAD